MKIKIIIMMLILSVSAMSGCEKEVKTEIKATVTEIQDEVIENHKEVIRGKDEYVNPVDYIDNLESFAMMFEVEESIEEEYFDYNRLWKNEKFTIADVVSTSSRIEDYEYPDFYIEIREEKYISVWGFGINDLLTYYMDKTFLKHGYEVEYDGRSNEPRSVTYTKVCSDRIIYISFEADRKTNKISGIKIYSDFDEDALPRALLEEQESAYSKYVDVLRKEDGIYDECYSEFVYIDNKYIPKLLTWHGNPMYGITLYYINKKGNIKEVKAENAINFSKSGYIKTTTGSLGTSTSTIYELNNNKLITIAVAEHIKTEGASDIYYWNDEEISEDRYISNLKKYGDKDFYYRTYSTNAELFGGYSSADEAIDSLNSRVEYLRRIQIDDN